MVVPRWYHERIRVPIYMYYNHPPDNKNVVLYALAGAYALTGVGFWILKLKIRAVVRDIFAFIFGL